MYTPVFQQDGNLAGSPAVNGNGAAAATAEPLAEVVQEEPEIPPETPSAESSKKRRIWPWVAVAALLLAGGSALIYRIASSRQAAAAPSLPALPVAAGPENAVRIIAGYDRKYIDHYGHTWSPDRFFDGGGQPKTPFRQFIARTADPLIYQNGRIGAAGYNIPLKQPGTYEMKLHFVEPVYGPGLVTGGGENSRVFDILINGKLAIDGFDIVSDAGGPLIADVRVFKDVQPGPDGILHLTFHARREQTIISAIEIEPSEPHKLNPIRIVTQPNSVIDSRGQVWEADNYFLGGETSNHYKSVTDTPDADLFASERYGHFSYAVPVAPGTYAVNLYFAETYWGKENDGGGGSGQRVFDIYCNGTALVRNLDILKEADPNRALIKRFRGLRPTAQGKLNLEFVPVLNYASVFAIEVLDESR
jgi:hypothetical protein